MRDAAVLIEPQIPALRRYAFALTRDHAKADDLVQDCLERAISRWYLRADDPDLRARLAAAGEAAYEADFTREIVTDRLVACYGEAIRLGRRKH